MSIAIRIEAIIDDAAHYNTSLTATNISILKILHSANGRTITLINYFLYATITNFDKLLLVGFNTMISSHSTRQNQHFLLVNSPSVYLLTL